MPACRPCTRVGARTAGPGGHGAFVPSGRSPPPPSPSSSAGWRPWPRGKPPMSSLESTKRWRFVAAGAANFHPPAFPIAAVEVGRVRRGDFPSREARDARVRTFALRLARATGGNPRESNATSARGAGLTGSGLGRIPHGSPSPHRRNACTPPTPPEAVLRNNSPLLAGRRVPSGSLPTSITSRSRVLGANADRDRTQPTRRAGVRAGYGVALAPHASVTGMADATVWMLLTPRPDHRA